MKALLGAMLISVFFISAFAPMAIASTAPTLTTHPRIVIGNVESTNWSGYAVTGSSGSVTAAEGSWIVPSVTCPSRGSTYAAFWVGIDGYSSDTVEQTGVLAQCSNGVASYSAWYEFYPAAMVTISSITVSALQTISASVTYSATSGKFTVTLTDTNTGKAYSTTGSVSGAARSSAEWVVERPEVCSGFRCQLTTLANFGTAGFGYLYTGLSGTCYATVSGVSGPISSFTNHAINMVSSSGSTLDTTNSLSSDGTSFTVTYG